MSTRSGRVASKISKYASRGARRAAGGSRVSGRAGGGSRVASAARRAVTKSVSRSASSSVGGAAVVEKAVSAGVEEGGGMMATVMEYLKSPWVLLGILVVAGLIYYFMVYRPQQEMDREQAEQEAALRHQAMMEQAMANDREIRRMDEAPEMTAEQIEMLRQMHAQAAAEVSSRDEEKNLKGRLVGDKSAGSGDKQRKDSKIEKPAEEEEEESVDRPSDEEIMPQIAGGRSEESEQESESA